MKKELENLLKIAGTKKFEKQLNFLHEKYKNRPGYKEEVAALLKSRLTLSAKNIEKAENAVNLKKQLGEVSEILSLSYIARTYFGKTRAWLHQRINGNMVNGKRAQFSGSELQQFQHALKDISKKLGSLSIK